MRRRVSDGGGYAGPSHSSRGVWCCATISVVSGNEAGGKPSAGQLAGGKVLSGDEVDAAAIPSSEDYGTNDEGDGTGVTEGGGLFL